MSTAPLVHLGRREAIPARVSLTRGSDRSPTALSAALLVLLLYAAFAHGAVSSPAEPRLQVALAALTAVAGAAWLWSGTLRLSAPRIATAGVALLTAFAVWSGITVLWSVAPDNTWLELNRALSYVLVAGLGIALGASSGRSLVATTTGFLTVVIAVTIYALGQKVVPGLHVAGLFDLNQTGPLPRLQEPLGYWNALALFVAMGAPGACMIAGDATRPTGARVAALVALQLILITIGLTYSRGGVLAGGLGIAIAIALSHARLRSLMWFAAALLVAFPPLVFGLVSHSLTQADVSLGRREGAGAILGAVLLASAGALIIGARQLLRLERRVSIGPERARTIVRLLLAGIGLLVVVAVLAVSFSSRGLDGTLSHAWKSFTTTRGSSVYDPHRLLSADSQNRWVWWKEAAGAFSDRPLGGWGAGSFPVTHLLYRRDGLSVKQPHSVPLQWLAETGLIGAGLAIAAFGLLLAAGVTATRRRAPSSERMLMAALLGGAAAYAVHSLYDWDWDIPAVTLPALLFLGVLAGCSGRGVSAAERAAPAPTTGLRGPALVTLTLLLCLFAVSSALPGLAAGDASSAILTASGGSPAMLQSASRSAAQAGSLDPLSDAGPSAEASIALRRGQRLVSRADLLEAIRRDPSDPRAWANLGYVELALGNRSQANRAVARALALDPRGQFTGTVAGTVSSVSTLSSTPPAASATGIQLPQP